MRLALLFYGAMFIGAFIVSFFTGKLDYWWPSLGDSPPIISIFSNDTNLIKVFKIAEDLAYGFLFGLLVVRLSRFLTVNTEWGQKLSFEIYRVIGPLPKFQYFALALLSAVAEEALFRGTLQPMFGIYITSLLFGLLHIGPKPFYLLWTVFAIGMGFLCGWLFEFRNGLPAPVALHFTVNYLNLLWLHKVFRGQKAT